MMKIVVLGGGPGGYVAAIRAAQLGAEVTLIEKNKIGGTCLNVGCIPTKVLLHSAEVIEVLKHSSILGIDVQKFELNLSNLMNRKESVVNALVEGTRKLLASNGVEILNGTAVFEDPKTIFIKDGDDALKRLSFDACILALGSVVSEVPIPGTELTDVVTSSEALAFDSVPHELVIVGGGVIGVEFADIYASFGSKVTIVEMMDSMLSMMDSDIVDIARMGFEMKGVKILEKTRVKLIKRDSDQPDSRLIVEVEGSTGISRLPADKVLMAVGRRPSTDNVGLEQIGIELNRGAIVVDDRMRTNIKGIYAIGDCNGGVMLAHVASSEAIVAVETIMGHRVEMDFKTIPSAIYTRPEIASVGWTEKEAISKGYQIEIGKYPLIANGKAQIMMEEGLVKIVADAQTREILGVHMIGPRATDIIAEAAIALRLEATVDELVTTIHAHPTVSEAVLEAGHGVFGRPIHLPK
jgi:dihydrolipoamide dehydrogenase